MRKRMNEVQFKELKATFTTLKRAGKKVSQIRDMLGIGNGTAKYIDESETFAQYCKMRDEVLHRSNSVRKQEEKRLQKKAVEAAKATIEEQPKRKYTRRTPVESPANVEKLIRENITDLRTFLVGDYADAIVARVVTALTPVGEEVKDAATGRTWFGTRKH